MSRAMVVVAAGSGTRFDGDKLMTPLGGRLLIELTVNRLLPLVDELVLVCRPDQQEELSSLGVTLADGGPTRTDSEISGLRALRGDHELIGIHDGARPNVFCGLVERLFAAAREHGGAVPVIPVRGPVVSRADGSPMPELMGAQTPQVFRSEVLLEAFRRYAGEPAHDTAEVVGRLGAIRIAAVPGDPRNVKVTYRDDLAKVIL
ncbi:MAG: 2-C-methyl-D-erythritol 4-phosphate cytidylyltransferase [Actinomycetes bacterium]|nr:MAG: hypothetical protein DIU67_03105 [Actinomycetota bacterium]